MYGMPFSPEPYSALGSGSIPNRYALAQDEIWAEQHADQQRIIDDAVKQNPHLSKFLKGADDTQKD